MNIAVLIKQVPSGNVNVDPVTHALIRQNSESVVNPADLNAIEAAMQLKEACGAEVTVITMGPPDAEKSLRTALAMGCDNAVLVTDRVFGGADTIATAKVLAAALKKLGGFDLVLAGAQSSDGATGQVGPMVAEYLSVPHVTEVLSVEKADSGNAVAVSKKHNNKLYRLGVKLPALATVNFGANSPRLTTLRSQRAAKSKEINTLTNAELLMEASSVGLAGSPTVVVRSYQPETSAQAVFLSGSDEEVAAKIMQLIAKVQEVN